MARPQRITLRSYQVGFGDCFLLGFHYKTSNRYVLIDFGSTAAPKHASKNHMVRVAKSIKEACNGKLHAVVATHRHKDHISGFTTRKDGTGSGNIIASLKPDVVIQPWTEDPAAKPKARRPTKVSQTGKAFVGMLDDMHAVAKAIADEVEDWPQKSRLRAELHFMGVNNSGMLDLANRSAVENLMRMSKRRRYVHFGTASGLRLPGVKVRVLGPPTMDQTDTIRTQRRRDEDEFWHLLALAGDFEFRSRAFLFPGHYVLQGARPKSSRWLLSRIRPLRREQLRAIVRILDKALNNTSVILLFEVGKHKLLFPGDAQIENWNYALSKPEVQELLEDVTLYKVGHHGSLNATPKTLWNGFRNHRSNHERDTDPLLTFVSTLKGKHGSTRRDTEVPRRTLVAELKKESRYRTTEKVKAKDLFLEEVIPV